MKKTLTIIFVSLILFFISYEISSLQNEASDTGRIVQIATGLFGAFLLVYRFLYVYTDQVKKFHTALPNKIHLLLYRCCGLRPHETTDDSSKYSNENSPHFIDTRNFLIDAVKKVCDQIIKNIEDSSVIISDSFKLTRTEVYYDCIDSFVSNKLCEEVLSRFEKLNRNIIVGNPGSGKTYFLMDKLQQELSKTDVARVQASKSFKIPVYVSLSSWEQNLSFNNWLSKAIGNFYSGLNEGFINSLIEKNLLFVFADGLDEVRLNDRENCFEAILNFANDNSIVFSCRKEELQYLISNDTLLINNKNIKDLSHITVHELLPLSGETIKMVIRKTKGNSEEIISFLNQHNKLYDFVQDPLRLNLFLKVYNDSSGNFKQRISQINMSDDDIEKLLWEEYDTQIFKSKYFKRVSPFEENVFRTYLVWLAKKMHDSSFFIEEMQPSWLGESYFYYYVVSRFVSCFVLSIAIGFFIAEPFDFIGNCIWGSLFVVLLTLWLNKHEKKVFKHPAIMVIVFSFVLIIFTSIYQGFAVPRIYSDMLGPFSKTEAFAGFLVGLFLGVVFGFRKTNQSFASDINPAQRVDEEYYFNPADALKTGTIGGIGIGAFLGIAAYFIHSALHNNYFDRWLEQNSERYTWFIQFSFLHNSNSELICKIIFFGFTAGFFIGFLIFSLLGGRQKRLIVNSQETSEGKKKEKRQSIILNLGIRKAIRFSFVYGMCVSVIVASAYGAFIYFITRDSDSVYRAMYVGIGTGIIAFLWFGGLEFIQHWILRLYLYFYGIVPLWYSNWLHTAEDLALIRRVGPSLQFYHPNLKGYYKQIPIDDEKRRVKDLKDEKGLRRINSVVFISWIVLIIYPIANRFLFKAFWGHQNEIRLITMKDSLVQKVNDTTIRVLKNGILTVQADGRIKLGTFTGSVNAAGTEIALLGFPIGNVYNIKPNLKQGALLFALNSDTTWSALYKAKVSDSSRSRLSCCLDVKKNETIRFQINDLEWRNNRGHLHIRLSLADTCADKIKSVE